MYQYALLRTNEYNLNIYNPFVTINLIQRKERITMEYVTTFIAVFTGTIIANLLCKWIDVKRNKK
jgi:hypothetical protein